MTQTCSSCGSVLPEVYILCVECEPKLSVCVRCFARGAEPVSHKNDHRYTVVTTEFPLLCKTWTATEELKLLDALLENGIGNWADISKQVGTRSAKDCEAHYMQYYIYAPIDHLKGIAPVPTCEGTCQVASIPYKVSGEPPRPALGSQQQVDMAGYMSARGDFSHEFDNYAEMDVANLDFTNCEDELDKGLVLNDEGPMPCAPASKCGEY